MSKRDLNFTGFPNLILEKIFYYHVSNNCYFCKNRRTEEQLNKECSICKRALCNLLPICKDFCEKCQGIVCRRCQFKCPRCDLKLCLKCFNSRECCNIMICAGCERRITPIRDPTYGQGCGSCGEFFCKSCYCFCPVCRIYKCIMCSGEDRCNECGITICGGCQVCCDFCQGGTFCGPCLDVNDARCEECRETGNDELNYF
jgi:hypothetical protein